MRLSFVIPLYNEEKRIQQSCREIIKFRQSLPFESEWIFVNDGSTDRTELLAREELGKLAYRWLNLKENQGKGWTVRQGVLEATGDYVFFSDADLSTPLSEYEGLLKALEDSFSVAIGSRALSESRILARQNWVRQTMGKIFNRIARALAFKGIRDSQCGFKGFKRDAAQKLFSLQKIRGFSFDAEIIYLAQKLGFEIAEIPVTWVNAKGSKVHMIRDSFQMLLDLFRIQWLHRDLREEDGK
jgi:dolichyl-phosphate beta-glucosyltransferase